ncbi:MAG TPA: hypothetical protein VF074_20640, partial [Pyrinomonadaceae bacterium]
MRSKLLILIFVLSVACFSSCARFSKESVKIEASPQPQTTPQATPQASSRFPAQAGFVNDYANVL